MAERRPIASRDTGWARTAAEKLAASGITPNQISQMSVVFAILAGAAFWLSGHTATTLAAALLILAALGCQLRLICNLLDGMVAIEGGKSAPDGPFWNEAPDRFADIAIFAGAGLGTSHPALGFAAAAAAVLTAYIRELGRAEGFPADFSGPFAKPQRMAAITVAALAAAIEVVFNGTLWSVTFALWLITLGAFVTGIRRAARLIRALKARG